MLKREKMKIIIQVVKTQKLVTADETDETLKVFVMIIRCDFNEVYKENKILHVHRGVQFLSDQSRTEKS